jgi:hypothetical protein
MDQASAEVRGEYSNLAQCVAGVVRDGGVPKLYTGLLASVAVSAPSSAVFVACYECSKNAIETATSELPPRFQSLHDFVPLLAAAVGNVAASVVRVPPEVIKQRVQAGIYRYGWNLRSLCVLRHFRCTVCLTEMKNCLTGIYFKRHGQCGRRKVCQVSTAVTPYK